MDESAKLASTWKAVLLAAVGSVVVLGCAFFIWPTVYRYDTVAMGEGTSYPVRTNRFTGKSEVLGVAGWVSFKGDEPVRAEDVVNLGTSELEKLEGRALITNYGYFKADIYNGTAVDIQDITVLLTVTNADGTIDYSRRYILTPEYSSLTGPQKSTSYTADVGAPLYRGQRYDWTIVGARGRLQKR